MPVGQHIIIIYKGHAKELVVDGAMLEYGERRSRSGSRTAGSFLFLQQINSTPCPRWAQQLKLILISSLISNNTPVTEERLEGKRT
mmetsp:Transcript_8890/g.12731  ORF Transcript_8890/g.12731 Transcript_8890/m.12731 type:complete len:86 (+) Transcript_8890:46-303(+)